MTTLPALFVSHGAPTLPLEDSPARHFLERLADALPARPEAILVVSAHWETTTPMVGRAAQIATIHDFFGFPAALYAMRYPGPGAPALADAAAALLRDAGFAVAADDRRGLDHGAWVPLALAWPAADIPVAQLSIQPQADAGHHYAMGRALEDLRAQQVLILASGSLTHDLSGFRAARDAPDGAEPAWVTGFADWVDAALREGRTEDLLAWRERAPFAARNHPTTEHLLPLFVALGAGGEDAAPRRLHQSLSHHVLRMDAFAFG